MTDALFFSLIPDTACIVICAVAAFIDIRSRRIPNKLTLPAIPIGLALSFALHARFGLQAGFFQGLLPSLFGAAFLFGCSVWSRLFCFGTDLFFEIDRPDKKNLPPA